MKALSVRQPWAWAIVHGGLDVLSRSSGTFFRGQVLIHASKNYDKEGKAWIQKELGIQVPPRLPRGGIVGRAVVLSCVRESDSPWFRGPVGLQLVGAEALPFLPCRGRLGFFDAPDQGLLFGGKE